MSAVADTGAAAFSFEPTGPARFAVGGAMTFATARLLHEAGLRALSGSTATELELDCAGVTAADSAGLAVLVDWLAWARRAGRSLRLHDIPTKLLDLARISELDALLAPA
ncbi:MAG: STAS domain-containing protein [Steroidobacteraceae bacterium]|nr:STAS domain-containing protein [Nevskiaceae bacterium]